MIKLRNVDGCPAHQVRCEADYRGCGAKVGEPCFTASGARSDMCHINRMDAARQAGIDLFPDEKRDIKALTHLGPPE